MTTTTVMRQTPYTSDSHSLVQITRPPVAQWSPSRFNARTIDDIGRMILWNTLSGAINVFERHQVSTVTDLLTQKGVRGEPVGLLGYLRDRGFLVPTGTDELRKLRLLIGQKHYRSDALEIIAMASEDCNFRCTYCYEDFKRGTMLPEVREGIKNHVRSRASALSMMNLSWFGGEPLYGWEAIEDLAPFFLETAREHNMQYWSHMTTNGYLLTPDKAEKLLEWHCRDFQITLDGTEEEHNKRRVGRDGSGTFQTILDNLRAMKARPDQFFIRLRHNFDKDSVPHLEEFVAMLQAEFSGDARFRLELHAIGKWGGDNDDALNTCGTEKRDVMVQIARSARAKNLGITSGVGNMAGVGKQLCYAARPHNFLIGADGKIMKCTIVLDKEDKNIIGKVHADGRFELDVDRLALWTEPSFERDHVCQNCHLVPMCQGSSCPLVRIQGGTRPCLPVKSTLRDELIATVEEREHRARQVAVPVRDGVARLIGRVPEPGREFMAAGDC